ncbi:4241_t:CDS:2 [Racocetra fulgida]|uniref:4241_t:CDS:1 n=1 Tax=Racocetra fulgida TaxID=60492 RepID=A0A9N8Z3A6_9GLOM|nr:4241_t:CDS:2 [Racocetra fulgida]
MRKGKKSNQTDCYEEASISTSSSSSVPLTPQLRTIADWEEADRIQEYHFMLKHILGGNYGAPLSKIIKPGTQEFPEADVYGIDITPSFPNKIKPKNCYFQTCDILEGLPFEDNRFDYVFMRYMHSVMKKHQWPAVLKDIMRVMKPGGMIESVELNAIPYSMGPVHTEFVTRCGE